MNNLIAFTITFLFGLLYFRALFLIIPKYFDKPFTRTKSKLQVHHLHFGIVFVLIATYLLLALGEHLSVYIFLGLGLGQIFDLFIASLLMKGDRPEEMRLYKKTFPHTLILGLVILVIALVIRVAF